MSASKDILSVKDVVEKLLRDNPKLRDSDKALFARMVTNIAGGKSGTKVLSMYDFLTTYVTTGKYPDHDAVGRARRQLQKENPDLRGKKYKERHQEEIEVKRALGYEAREESSII